MKDGIVEIKTQIKKYLYPNESLIIKLENSESKIPKDINPNEIAKWDEG